MIKRLQRCWRPGIRMQLTLWYTCTFVVLFLLSGLFLYWRLQTELVTSYDGPLKTQTEQIIADITNDNGAIDEQDISEEILLLDHSTLRKRSEDTNVDLSALVRILDTKGHVLGITDAFGELTVPAASVTEPLQGSSWQGTIMASDGTRVRLYSIRIFSNNTFYGIIQVGDPLNSLDSTLDEVVEELIFIAPFALLLSIIGSYWLARRAFIPIYHLTHIAEDISAGDLDRRVPVPRAKDEVQLLALTFNKMIGRLNKAFLQQRRFVADASHELRTPVAAIRSMTDVALAQPPQLEEYRSILSNVNGEAERLGWLIRDLLILARADEGQIPLDYELVRLDHIVSDVIATLEPLAVEKGILLEATQLAPATVNGDISRLIQCVINLLDNALAYTNIGGKVTLAVESKGQYGCIIVRDTGMGIPPEEQTHIFERFYRSEPARARKASGSGLGLSIVDWIIQAHGGSIQVESHLGHGTTFTLLIPLAPIA